MKKFYSALFLSIVCVGLNAQNLVPNGGFENYSGCPGNVSDIDSALFWTGPSQIGGGSPDYFHPCNTGVNVSVPHNWVGYQQPHSGLAYAGIYISGDSMNIREYVETSLTTPLVANVSYYFQMYVCLANISMYKSAELGVYFSDTLVEGILVSTPLNYVPQINNNSQNYLDSATWMKVSGTYLAHGGESYLIIGNFKYDSLTPVIFTGNTFDNFPFSYSLIDDVYLAEENPDGMNDNSAAGAASVYPNPVNDLLQVSVNSNDRSEITVYDLAGRNVMQQSFVNSASLNTSALTPGVYLYVIRNESGELVKTGKIAKQ